MSQSHEGFRGSIAELLGFKAWKSAARLCSALDCLAKGMSIKQTALHLGFSGPGPFSAAFTKFFGLTPGSLVQSLGKQKDR